MHHQYVHLQPPGRNGAATGRRHETRRRRRFPRAIHMKHRRGSARGIDKHVCGKQGSKREAKGKQKGSKREQKGAKGSGASRANPRGTRILDGVCVQDLEAKTLPISLNAALAARVLLTCEGAE
jgi:hypothetical protein